MKLTEMPADSQLVASIKSSLTTVARSQQGTALGDAAREILEGRADVAALLSAPGVQEGVTTGRAMQEQRLIGMSPAQRSAEQQIVKEKSRELLQDPFVRLIQLQGIRDVLKTQNDADHVPGLRP